MVKSFNYTLSSLGFYEKAIHSKQLRRQSYSCLGAKGRTALPGRGEYQAASHRPHASDAKPKSFNEVQNISSTASGSSLEQNHLSKLSLRGVSDPIKACGAIF